MERNSVYLFVDITLTFPQKECFIGLLSVVAGGGMLMHTAFVPLSIVSLSLKKYMSGRGYNAAKGLFSRDIANLFLPMAQFIQAYEFYKVLFIKMYANCLLSSLKYTYFKVIMHRLTNNVKAESQNF